MRLLDVRHNGRVQAIRAERQIGLQDAKRIVEGEILRSRIESIGDIEDVRRVLRVMADMLRP